MNMVDFTFAAAGYILVVGTITQIALMAGYDEERAKPFSLVSAVAIGIAWPLTIPFFLGMFMVKGTADLLTGVCWTCFNIMFNLVESIRQRRLVWIWA